MPQLRTLDEFGDLRGTRVLLRIDVNTPIRNGRVVDDARIRLAIPTIDRLQRAGARCIGIAHLGAGSPRETLAPVVRRLASMLGRTRVQLLRARIGTPALGAKLAALRRGSLAVLENIRWYPGEVENDRAFARSLAALGDVYVNDAFSVSHRAHASVARIAEELPSVAGPLMEHEVHVLSRLLEHPASPFIGLLGGAKISTKVPVIENLLRVTDAILLGGALVHPFLVARKYGVGGSFMEPTGVRMARRLLRASGHRNLMLPIDVVVGPVNGRGRHARVVALDRRKPFPICEADEAIVDIGPATIRAYSEQIRSAATIVWNGPVGMFERPPFHHGTIALARVVAARSSGRAFGVVGGGETIAALAMTGMSRYIDHVSGGGGAMLAFLAGEALPGLVPLFRS